MDHVEVRVVDTAEAPRAVSAQLTAFTSDPCMRALWPEPHEYLRNFPKLVRAFGGGAFDNNTAHIAGDFQAGSLWLPPGVLPDGDALDALFKETLREPALSAAPSVVEQMGECHPHEPHWHLAFIGVDPACQGQGIGAVLLQHVLKQIDAQHLHAYLESSNPANVPFGVTASR